MDVGFIIADVVGCCWDAIPAIASANLLSEMLWSLDARFWVFSNIGKVVSRYSCLIVISGCVVHGELKYAQRGIRQILVGRSVLPPCDWCVFAGQ